MLGMYGWKSVSKKMTRTKLQRIKYVIKITIVCVLLFLFVVLGFCVKHTYTFENSSIKKWTILTESQRIATLKRIIPDAPQDMDLLIQCITKIAQLPDSGTMDIRDGAALCYNGIKLNNNKTDEE